MKFALVLFTGLFFFQSALSVHAATPRTTWWQFQSIDTMKYSRDLAREKLNDQHFDLVIENQIKNIAATGASYVAIATPYDEEFIPFLARWVYFARKYQLHVWFRGNFSGWEGWFNYPKLSRQDHLQKIAKFIAAHPDLFTDGDIFSACPECENGGPGDPRQTRDIEAYRQFLISEYKTSKAAFTHIGKKIYSNVFSMNADVARLIMDPPTTAALDSLVSIDHYVTSPEKLSSDIQKLADSSKGNIILSEFGVPIPDINGSMSDVQQSVWLQSALQNLVKTKSLIGLNYWTSVGGSTQLWKDTGEARPAVVTLTSFYFPAVATGIVVNVFGEPITQAQVSTSLKTVYTDQSGHFQIPYLNPAEPIIIYAPGYLSQGYNNYSSTKTLRIILEYSHVGILIKLKYLIFNLIGRTIHN